MVSQALVQAKVNYGFGKAAAAVGSLCQWYRPSGTGPAIGGASWIGTLPVLFDTAADMLQKQPSRYAKDDDWYGAFDATSVCVGDYFTDPKLGTFFVAALEYLKPARLVRCNRVVTVTLPGSQPPGPTYYGGDVLTAEEVLLSGWPASIVQGTKGEKGEVMIPGDIRLPWFNIILPLSVGEQIKTADNMTDDQAIPIRYTVSSAEQTLLGWRFTAGAALP
jgi:hypothetical protein